MSTTADTAALRKLIEARLDEISADVTQIGQRMSTKVANLEAKLGAPAPIERKVIGGLAGYTTPGERLLQEEKTRNGI
jgi:hypothetical protein